MKPIHQLKRLINELSPEKQDGFSTIVDALAKEIEIKNFQIKRLEIDSNLINNILTNTIEELESKKVILEKQNYVIEEQARFKETLFANVSHELRTPLHGIIGMSRLLFNTKLNNEQHEFVDIVKNSADNLLVIINDILNLSKINSGNLELVTEVFDTTTLFKDLRGILQEKASRKGLELIFEIDPEVPKYFTGDYTRLTQILLNLLNNAIKFTHAGFVSMIAKAYPIDDQKAEFTFQIKDSGIGIKQEKLTQIFESFIQVHEQRGIIYEGAGLGLNIVRNLLTLMNGTIAVESKLNEGTNFYVTIPLTVPNKSEVNTFLEKNDNVKIKEDWNDQKILVLEDNKANMLYARKLLEEHGIIPDESESIAQARKFICSKKYDFMLIDVKLPDGNGIDLIRDIRNNKECFNWNTNILVLTASANEIEKNSLAHLKIAAYLPKPFPPEVLLKELRKGQSHTKREPKQEENQGPREIRFQKSEEQLDSLMLELMQIYLDELPTVINELENGIKERDYQKIGFIAHKFRSNNKFLGFEQTANTLGRLERGASDKIEFSKLKEWIDQFLIQVVTNRKVIEEKQGTFEKSKSNSL